MTLFRALLLAAVLAALCLVFWPERPETLVIPCPTTPSAPAFPRSPDLFSHVPQPKAA